jgi:seryl-tRNA synthetase
MVKIILCAVSIGAILYGLRLWGNSQWYKGETQGRITATQSIENAKLVEWKAKEAAIAAGTATLDTEMRAIKAATEQLSQDRANLSRSLKASLAQIQRERSRQYESTAAVPDPLLWDALRAVSRELAAAQP